jgi:hypothetical protein
MRLKDLERSRNWQATVEYYGSGGQQTICLLHDGIINGGHHWFIPDYAGARPWGTVRKFDPRAAARMVASGKMRLVKGQWPRSVVQQMKHQPHGSGQITVKMEVQKDTDPNGTCATCDIM